MASQMQLSDADRWELSMLGARGAQKRDTARPILEGLHALACELNSGRALGEGTETALSLLESTQFLVRMTFLRKPQEPEGDNRPEIAQGGLAGWQVQAFNRHIDANLAEKICLKSLAASVRLSPSYLCRACRQTFQCSPMQYVMLQRVAAAKAMLRDSTTSLSELALMCGFADQAHFTRVFRAATGETPRRWRRQWSAGREPSARTGGATALEVHFSL